MIEGKDITVITATIPGRGALLNDCMESVSMQTILPADHIVICDDNHEGVGITRNCTIRAATTEWIAIIDDDDIMYPDHLAVLAEHCDQADIVYSLCEVKKLRSDGTWVTEACPFGTREFDLKAVTRLNYIPVTVLARRQLLLDLPFQNRPRADWDLWIRAGKAGKRFVFVPKVTWAYRWHPGNGSSGGVKWV
jgi:glycosyltransferase involved in cell wall biosynthesis